MDILLLTTHLNVGGIPRYVISLAKFLASGQNNVFVASSGGKWQCELQGIKNISSINIPINTKSIFSFKAMKSFFMLRRFLKTQHIDIVHAHTRVSQFLAFLLYKKERIPYVSTFHGCYRPHFLRKAFKFEGRLCIAVSNYVKNHLIEKLKLDKSKIRVIYNGIDIRDYKQEYNSPVPQDLQEVLTGSPILGTVSRLTPEKNIDLLIEAIPFILKKFPAAQLIILGQGRQDTYLKKLSEKLSLGDRVVFLKDIPANSAFKKMDIFISLSEGEPFGLSVIEAQSLRVPVIVSSSGAFLEIVDDGETGVVLKNNTASSVCGAVELILNNKDLREKLISNASSKVDSLFNIGKMGDYTLSVYKEALKKMSEPCSKRIVVIVPNWIGDCLMATPVLRALRENIKNSYIAVLGHPRVIDVFRFNPNLDEIIEFDFKKGIFPLLDIIFRLSPKKFDTAFLLKPSFTKSLVCRLSGVRNIYGCSSKKITFINKSFEAHGRDEVHKMDYYLNTVTGLGLKLTKREPEIFLSNDELDKATRVLESLPEASFRIVIHPKANWHLKMWPVEAFAGLADKLISELKASVIITGTAQDLELAHKIESLMANKPRILAGTTSLRELAAILSKVDLFISGDTGIMHLASSIHTPVLALFGPTHPSISGPRASSIIKIVFNDVGCKVPCYKSDCLSNICMKGIGVDRVFEAAKNIISA